MLFFPDHDAPNYQTLAGADKKGGGGGGPKAPAQGGIIGESLDKDGFLLLKPFSIFSS